LQCAVLPPLLLLLPDDDGPELPPLLDEGDPDDDGPELPPLLDEGDPDGDGPEVEGVGEGPEVEGIEEGDPLLLEEVECCKANTSVVAVDPLIKAAKESMASDK
jgi:hypothetical protein